jgi:carbon monoxide dehydrogenase subunit G
VKVAGEYKFEAPVAEVWTALLDPVVLAAVMPGCEKLEMVDGGYVGDLNVKVGPVQGKFHGKVLLADVEEEEGYTMTVDGRVAQGFVKAKVAVKLTPEGRRGRSHQGRPDRVRDEGSQRSREGAHPASSTCRSHHLGTSRNWCADILSHSLTDDSIKGEGL